MQAVGAAYRAAGVAAVYLVHGTFVGHDAFGVLGELARLFPAAGEFVRNIARQLINKLTDEAGNYTSEFADLFEISINAPGQRRIPVRLFEWSSENNHIGRADGAVRLINELGSLELTPGQRLLMWGHSHAGNVFALVSQLCGGDRDAIEKFFAAAQVYYTWPLLGCTDIPFWRQARKLLSGPRRVLADRPLDFVTFGTPIRYGWNSAGYGRLLHFVYHRPAAGLPDYQAPFPPSPDRVMRAADGDYVQQLGIAGTNIPPSIFSWRARWAENRLANLLQNDLGDGDMLDRLRAGARVSESGTTLLVDYGLPTGGIWEHHAGHALYTRKDWLLFHAEETVKRLYENANCN